MLPARAAKAGAAGPDLTAMQQNLEYYDWNILQGKLVGTPQVTAAEQTKLQSTWVYSYQLV